MTIHSKVKRFKFGGLAESGTQPDLGLVMLPERMHPKGGSKMFHDVPANPEIESLHHCRICSAVGIGR